MSKTDRHTPENIGELHRASETTIIFIPNGDPHIADGMKVYTEPPPSPSHADLVAALESLIQEVKDWCDAVDQDASWDGWDDHFKNFHYHGGLDRYRAALSRARGEGGDDV